MLALILILNVAWSAPMSRESSKSVLQAGCLRSEVHTDADKRRVICDCIVRNMAANPKLTDAQFDYLARSWAEPDRKIEPRIPEADVVEDYDEDLMELCTQNPRHGTTTKGKAKLPPKG